MRKLYERIQEAKDRFAWNRYMATIRSLYLRGISLPQIGKRINKDHTTIIYHLQKNKDFEWMREHHNEELKLKEAVVRAQKRAKWAKKTKTPEVKNCRECDAILRRPNQNKFCSHDCSNKNRTGKIAAWWPKWIKNEQDENISTGKSYKDYIKHDGD